MKHNIVDITKLINSLHPGACGTTIDGKTYSALPIEQVLTLISESIIVDDQNDWGRDYTELLRNLELLKVKGAGSEFSSELSKEEIEKIQLQTIMNLESAVFRMTKTATENTINLDRLYKLLKDKMNRENESNKRLYQSDQDVKYLADLLIKNNIKFSLPRRE